MKTTFSFISYSALLLLLTLNLQLSTFAQGTAFTYQGRLNSGTNPANGSYDISFSLFAVSSGGGAIAGPVTNSAVTVSNGLFTTTVNLGNPFTGASNWLELAVSTNGANAFFTLAPRQQLTPTPYAIYAETANASSLIGTGFFSGNVGIGVTNPVDLLDVATGGVIGNSTTSVAGNDPSNRGTKVSFGYRDPFSGDFNGMRSVVNPGSICGNSGDLLFYTWACNVSVTREVMRINGAGNVGIGTTNPLARLDINGNAGIETNNALEFGLGVAGKEVNAGKIAYERFTPNSLDIVGAGTNVSARKVAVFAEGGTIFNGDVSAVSFTSTNITATNIFASHVGIGTTQPQLPLDVSSPIYAQPAAQFSMNNCGGPCAQTDWQEAIRLWNQNGNGQVGLGFLVGTASFNSNAVPNVWLGTHYGGNANDFKIATRTGITNLITRLYLNGTSGNLGIGTTSPDALLSVNGTADKPGGGSWTTFSDGRLKDVGAKFTHGLEDLANIQPVHYHYKSDNPLNLPSGPEYVGVVAQQVQQAVPEAVQQSQTGYLTVNNDPIIWTMVNAIKELNQKVEAKDAENAELKARLDKLEQLLNSKAGEAK